jgi:hypothetical protein
VSTGGGNDIVCGSSGPDRIFTGSGNDIVLGNGGNDVISAGTGNDTVDGGSGNDTILGGPGNDNLSGGAGNDRVSGETGNDTESGGVGNDSITGGTGADTEAGDAGNDSLSGDAGNDSLSGGSGNDSLSGGAGSDNLDGNDGTDTEVGGDGTDTLHVDGGDHHSGGSGDSVNEDSRHAAVPSDVAAALTLGVKYLGDGIKAGDVTGSGKQVALPDAPTVGTAPDGSLIKDVTWNVTVKGDRTDVRGCVDGSSDGVNFFKLRLEAREGDDRGARPDHASHVTVGKCSDNFLPATAPDDLLAQLTANAGYLSAEISAGTLTGSGVSATVPSDGVNALPDGNLITVVQYGALPAQGDSGIKGRICLSGSSDGTAFYRFVGEVEGGVLKGETFAGACMPHQGDDGGHHGSGDPSPSPSPSGSSDGGHGGHGGDVSPSPSSSSS